MPEPVLDYLEYQGARVYDFFAIVNPENHKVLGVKYKNSQSLILSHSEAERILNQLSQRFNEENNQLNPLIHPIEITDINDSEFTFSMVLGSLDSFEIFRNFPVENITIGLACTNDYSYEGQLEVSLWYSHSQINNNMMVFDKWTVSSNKNLFGYSGISINPYCNNFENRNDLIKTIVEDIYEGFNESLLRLEKFVNKAHEMRIQYDLLIPVFLNIRDKNRSVTALKNSQQREESLRKEIKKVEEKIESFRKPRDSWTYLNFLEILSAFKFENNYRFADFNDFQSKFSSSQDYKDLLNTVEKLNLDDPRNEFEAEQLRLYDQIINILGIQRGMF
jgi:hypothetical protein